MGCDYTAILFLWMPTMFMAIAIMTTGIVSMASFNTHLVSRVGNLNYPNDTALLIDLGTGDLQYRVCDGRVTYTCNDCDDSSYSKAEPSVGPAPTPAPSSAAPASRTAMQLADTKITAAPGRVPDDECECGAILHFDRCGDHTRLINRCDELRTIAKPLAASVLAAGVIGCASFLVSIGSIFLIIESDDEPTSWRVLSLMLVWLGTGLGVIIPCAVAMGEKDSLMNGLNCKNAVIGEAEGAANDALSTKSFQDRQFTFLKPVADCFIVGIVFAALLLVVVAFNFLFACREGSGSCFKRRTAVDDSSPVHVHDAVVHARTPDSDDTNSNNSNGAGAGAGDNQVQMGIPVYPPRPSFGGDSMETNHPHCGGQHLTQTDAATCFTDACKGRKVCLATCESCPDSFTSFGAASNHPRCRGDHGVCSNPACWNRPICHAGCTSCPQS